MAKKVAVSGYYGFKNFGDELILSILIDNLKSQNADVTVFSVDPEYTSKTYGVKSVKSFDLVAVFKTLLGCDVLISGGGSLFQDATSLKSVLYYALVLGLAQFFCKKTVVFAQGVGPLYNPISRFLVRNLFKRADYVSVRDENSLSLLEKWGVKAELICDPVYSLNLPNSEKENALGVQLRSFSGVGEEFFSNLVAAIASGGAVKVFSLQKTLDYEVCKKFADKVDAQVVEDNLIEELGKVETLVSMRFHALVVALKSGVKCVGVNYDPKVSALCEKYSLPLIEFNDTVEVIQNKIKNAKSVELKNENFPWDKLDFCK